MPREKEIEIIIRAQGYSGDEAFVLMIRTRLLLAVKTHFEKRQWTQAQAATVLEVRQPRISEIYNLQIDKFSIELLLKYMNRLGLTIKLETSI